MTGKEAYGVNASKFGKEDVVLKSLLDAFGSTFSLDEIASAYLKADYSADLAAEILYQTQGSTPSSASNGKIGNGDNLCKGSENSYQGNGSQKTAKPKIQPFSAGTVSSVIGKEYARSKSSANQFTQVYKPVKVGVKVLHESSSEGDCTNFTSESHLHQDMENFLFKMLGDGFRLKREVIREVLGRLFFFIFASYLQWCLSNIKLWEINQIPYVCPVGQDLFVVCLICITYY